MEISSSPPLNTSPLLMSGFQLKVTLLKKGDVMLLWSDTVALMFLFCQAVTKTKVASVCPGVEIEQTASLIVFLSVCLPET